MTQTDCEPDDPEPRGLAMVIVLVTVSMRFVLPPSMSVLPPSLIFVIVGALLLGAVWSHRKNDHRLNNIFGYSMSGVLTLFLLMSLALLVYGIIANKEKGQGLLLSAGSLWISNILIFATWYWRIDAGGPNKRDLRPCHTDGDFLFPQMTLDAEKRHELGIHDWSPTFVDYLFVAFNTSTAFSPTDTAVLKPRAKWLTMLQALISLVIVALLAGRAVNIL